MPSVQHQIVVATEQLQLVAEELREGASVEVTRDGDIPRLELTLVGLPAGADPAKLADALWAEVPEEERTRLPDRHEAVDLLLASLRDRFRLRHSGWTPTMGKNRLLGGIELLPYASVFGFDLPSPVSRPEGVSPGRPPVPVEGPRPRGVRVGIMDVRLAPHPRLEGACLVEPDGLDHRPGEEPGADTPDPLPVRLGWQGHATFVANIILEQAPSAGLVVRTALVQVRDDGPPEQRFRMPLWRFAEKLVEFEDAGVQVLNCSMGCETIDGRPPLVLERAIARLSPTMVVVAAAGNHGLLEMTSTTYLDLPVPEDRSAALFPAALDGVLAVGAREPDGSVADFNPRGGPDHEWAPWIDGFSPGRDVVSAYLGEGREEIVELPPEYGKGRPVRKPFGGWAKWTGTSFAAAHATGRIAALIAAGRSPGEALAEFRGSEDFWRR
jgi:hypothetical protein